MATQIHSLTQQQWAQLPAHAQRWIENSLRTAPADRPTFEAAARACYRRAGVPWHGNVVWVASPLVLHLAARIAALRLHSRRTAVIASFLQAVRRLAGDEAENAATAALQPCARLPDPDACAVGQTIGERVASPVQHAVWEAIEPGCREMVSRELRQTIISACQAAHGAIWDTLVEAGIKIGKDAGVTAGEAADTAWERGHFFILDGYFPLEMQASPAFTRFFLDVCGLELPRRLRPLHRAYEQTLLSASWWCPHRKFLLACERPREIHREPVSPAAPRTRVSYRLHRMDGPAMFWPHGWGVHAEHGRLVPGWIIEHPEAITVRDIEDMGNAEVRRVMLERYGWARYVADSGAEVVDTVPLNHPIAGLRGARLLRKWLAGEPEPLVYLEMVNSTPEPDGRFRRYLERIDPKAYDGEAGRSVHAAMASRWRHRDENGRLQLTFGRWQDYRPSAES